MTTSPGSRELSSLLSLSRSLDIVGDVSVTVDHPSELLAWATALRSPKIFAWRGNVSGKRFVHVTAVNATTPVHGRITAALRGDDHLSFWQTLVPHGDLPPGAELSLTVQDLATAWEQHPLRLPEAPTS